MRQKALTWAALSASSLLAWLTYCDNCRASHCGDYLQVRGERSSIQSVASSDLAQLQLTPPLAVAPRVHSWPQPLCHGPACSQGRERNVPFLSLVQLKSVRWGIIRSICLPIDEVSWSTSADDASSVDSPVLWRILRPPRL